MQINNLPDSLLIEILTRLPCQFAVQSKTVCKRWLSLISDPFFIRSFVHHQSLNHSSPFTLVHQFYYWHHHFAETASRKLHAVSEHPILIKSQELFLDFLPCFQHPNQINQWPIRIVASHGDLMVCHDNKLFSHQSRYYVCNLLTKQWRALPPIPGRHVEDDMAIGLVTYGDNLPIFNYKVVRVLKLGSHSSHLIAEIFSSETGEWRESLLSCPQSICRFWQFRTSAVTLNNSLHWIINGNDGETMIVIDPFSGINGQCRLIDPPFELKYEMAHVCLGTCREKLRMSTIKGVHPNRMLKVWELQDYDKGEWLLQYRICLKEMVFVSDYQFNMLEFSTNLVLSFHPKDEDVVYLRCHNHIMKCNMRKGTLDVVSKCLGDPTFVIRTLTVFPLVHPCWPSSVHGQVKH